MEESSAAATSPRRLAHQAATFPPGGHEGHILFPRLARPGRRARGCPGAAQGEGHRAGVAAPPACGWQVCRGGRQGEAPVGSQGRAPASPCDPPSPLMVRWRSIVSRHNKTRTEPWSRQGSNVLTGGRKTSTDTLQLFGDGG